MSTVPTMATARSGRSPLTTTAAGRMAALARAELTLFLRSRGTLVSAVFVPLVLPFSIRSAVGKLDLRDAGLTVGLVVLPSAIGASLLFAVYATLVGVFVGRREQLVLKRLRTGEPRDAEILAGASIPAVVTAVAQSLILVAACTVLLHLPAPRAPHLAALGLALGLSLCVSLAAVTAAFTRTTEGAQVSSIPLIMLSFVGSGMSVPLEMMPETPARVLGLLPLSPVITLVRGGWTGEPSAAEVARAALVALAWTGVAVFAVRRWFRWEPRR